MTELEKLHAMIDGFSDEAKRRIYTAYASRQIARQALGEDAKPMPEGARRSRCPACGWTFGTHAPDCEVKHGQ